MIAIGADHGGVNLKLAIQNYFDENGIRYKDFGTNNQCSVDYGPIAAQVAHAVANGEAEKGILCCGTGIGISIAANKVKRASVRLWLPMRSAHRQLVSTMILTSCAWVVV